MDEEGGGGDYAGSINGVDTLGMLDCSYLPNSQSFVNDDMKDS